MTSSTAWPVRLGLWTAGAACFAVSALSAGAPELAFRRPLERGDLDAAERGDALLERVGQASAERRLSLGQEALRRGELARAERHLARSLELRPKAWAWVGLGDVHARRERWGAAAAAYESALGLDADHAVASFHLGVTLLRRRERKRARALLERARALAIADPERPAGLLEQIDRVLAETRPR